MERYYTTREVSELGLIGKRSPRAIRNLIDQGRIDAVDVANHKSEVKTSRRFLISESAIRNFLNA